jgi:hypothetical protein
VGEGEGETAQMHFLSNLIISSAPTCKTHLQRAADGLHMGMLLLERKEFGFGSQIHSTQCQTPHPQCASEGGLRSVVRMESGVWRSEFAMPHHPPTHPAERVDNTSPPTPPPGPNLTTF